jgi:hypothetical protein
MPLRSTPSGRLPRRAELPESFPRRLAEVIALAKPQGAHRAYAEHEHTPTRAAVAERPVAHDEIPRAVGIFDGKRGREGLELGVIGHELGLPLEHDVERSLGEVAAPGSLNPWISAVTSFAAVKVPRPAERFR